MKFLTRPTRLAGGSVAVLLLLAACGGSAAPASPSAASSPAAPAPSSAAAKPASSAAAPSSAAGAASAASASAKPASSAAASASAKPSSSAPAAGSAAASAKPAASAAAASTAPAALVAPAKANKQYHFGLAAGKVGNPGAREIYAGFTTAARAAGADVKILDADLDINKQISQVDQFINQKVDGIAIHLIGDPNAIKGSIGRAQTQGIHIVSFDEDQVFPNIDVLAYQNTEAEGQESAAFIAQQLGDKGGNVVVVGGPPVPVLERRVKAAQEEFAKHPNVKVLGRQDSVPDDATGGRKLGEQLVAKYSDLAAIWTVNDEIAQGVGAAVKAAGRNIMVTGLNGDQEGIDGIKQGIITATWDSLGTDFGEKAANAEIRILNGEIDKSQLPLRIFPQPVQFTKANVDQWVPPEKRIAYPQELKG